MKKLVLVLSVLFVLSGCVTTGERITSDRASGLGKTESNIVYYHSVVKSNLESDQAMLNGVKSDLSKQLALSGLVDSQADDYIARQQKIIAEAQKAIARTKTISLHNRRARSDLLQIEADLDKDMEKNKADQNLVAQAIRDTSTKDALTGDKILVDDNVKAPPKLLGSTSLKQKWDKKLIRYNEALQSYKRSLPRGFLD